MKEGITCPLSQICTYKTRVASETHTWYPTKCSQNTLPAQTLHPTWAASISSSPVRCHNKLQTAGQHEFSRVISVFPTILSSLLQSLGALGWKVISSNTQQLKTKQAGAWRIWKSFSTPPGLNANTGKQPQWNSYTSSNKTDILHKV